MSRLGSNPTTWNFEVVGQCRKCLKVFYDIEVEQNLDLRLFNDLDVLGGRLIHTCLPRPNGAGEFCGGYVDLIDLSSSRDAKAQLDAFCDWLPRSRKEVGSRLAGEDAGQSSRRPSTANAVNRPDY